jgi:hypothetical protein
MLGIEVGPAGDQLRAAGVRGQQVSRFPHRGRPVVRVVVQPQHVATAASVVSAAAAVRSFGAGTSAGSPMLIIATIRSSLRDAGRRATGRVDHDGARLDMAAQPELGCSEQAMFCTAIIAAA